MNIMQIIEDKKYQGVPFTFSKNNGIIRWRVGSFQSRKYFTNFIEAFVAMKSFIDKCVKSKLPVSYREISPVKKSHLTLVP